MDRKPSTSYTKLEILELILNLLMILVMLLDIATRI